MKVTKNFCMCVLLLTVAMANTVWCNVHAPLHAEIQVPESGFTAGAVAELVLSAWVPEVGTREEASLTLTLTSTGVAQVSGKSAWVMDNIIIGEVYQVRAAVSIAGDGEGEWRLEVISYNANGERLWGDSATLYVLQADNEVLHGKSSDLHLLEEKLNKDLEKGLLKKGPYEKEKEKLLSGQELDLQKDLKGLEQEKMLPRPKADGVVDSCVVSGKISYTHRTGRAAGANTYATAENARPLTEMLVEFYDKTDAATTKLATVPAEVRTDATGSYANVTIPGKRADGTAVNLEVQFLFDSPATTIGTTLANLSYISAPAVTIDAATKTVNYLIDSTSMNNLRRAHIHDAVLFAYNNTRSLIDSTSTGTKPEKISLIFPGSNNNGSYFSTTGSDHISIGLNHAFDWDVITHEYGHYVQKMNGTASNPGGLHYIDGNLSGFNQGARTLTKDQGIKMAWAEGWPTYFGTFLQVSNGAGSFGIFGAGDLVYTDTANTFSYDLESNANLSRPNGEDVELAVQRILWDFAEQPQDENDEVIFGHEQLWKSLHSDPKPLSLNDFRSKFNDLVPPVGTYSYTSGTQEQCRVKYGAVYHDLGVGPAPVAPEEGYTGSTPPKFAWQRKGAGVAPSYRFNKFNVVIYDKDFQNILFTSPEIPTAAGLLTDANNAEWTPTEEEWDGILANGEVLHWGVLGSHDGAPATGPYLGLTRLIGGPSISFVIDSTGSMGEEISGVRQALTIFIDILRLLDFDVNPLIEVIAFYDNVEHLIASRDLDAVQAVVDSLGANGGGDCPEGSAQALAAASKNMAAGGTIIFATDASPHQGYDLAGIKTAALAKGIIINQIVTGDCEASSPDKYFGTKSPVANPADSCNPGYVPTPESEQPVEWWEDVFCEDCPVDDSAGAPMTPNILKLLGDGTLPPVSSVASFTDLASASPKGHFLYMPEAKYGDLTPFINTVANTALAAVVPTVLAVQPGSGQQGTTLDVIIAGGSTNFRSNSAVVFSGSGITVNGITATSETEIVANITIADDATLDYRDITVTTPLGAETTEEAGGTGQFRVISPNGIPELVSVIPRTIAQATTETLTITGVSTNFADGVTQVIFGDGITADSVTVSSPTKLQVQITVAEDAPVGFRKITVQTGDETLELTSALSLVETLGVAAGTPTIDAVSPRDLPRNSTGLDLTVTGRNTNFVEGETVTTFSGSGITVVSTTVVSSTEATVKVNVAEDSLLGARDVLLTTGGETAAQIAGVVVVDSTGEEGEGESEGEGEGESAEGEGETVEGEGEPTEGEGEGEGEGEDTPKGCCSGCTSTGDTTKDIKRLLGDWLLVGLSILTLLALTTYKKRV